MELVQFGFYLFVVINCFLVNNCFSASLSSPPPPPSSSSTSPPSAAIKPSPLNDQIIYQENSLPNCSRADLTFANDDTIPRQPNGTSFLPDFDPTVVLNVIDAIVHGDLWNDVVSGVRTVFSHLRNRLSLNPAQPSTKSFAENSTTPVNQLPLVAFN